MKKRILVSGLGEGIGGVENFYINAYRNLDKSKYQIDFFTFTDDMMYKEEILKNGGNVYVAPKLRRHPIKHYKILSNILKNNKFDIFHANMSHTMSLLKLKLPKKYGVKKIIVHSHSAGFQDKFQTIINRLNKKRLIKYANEYLACSNRAGQWMFGNKIQFKLINNAMEVDKFKFDSVNRNEVRKELNIQDKYVIGHIGRFCKVKNHEFLIRFFYEYLKINENAVLLLIGYGEEEKRIRKLIEKLKLDSKVIIIHTTEIYRYYNAFDIFVLPSKAEGFPLVGIEAQINGLPCLFSNNITKELKVNENVEFLSIENTKEWVDNLSLNKENRIIKICDKLEEYNIEKALKKLEEIYNED